MRLYYLLFTVVSLLLLSPAPADVGWKFNHPGIPFNTEDLDQLKVNIKKEPWSIGYNAFIADPHSSLSYKMQGPFQHVGRAPNVNLVQWRSDMQAVHNLAFMWVFSGDRAYARKATDILEAWATTNTLWTGDETFLDIGDFAERYTTGADILRSTYPEWTEANTRDVKNWFAKVLWPQIDVPNPLRSANQGADELEAALGLAAFLDDREKWNQAVTAFRTDPGGGLPNSLSNGEVGDSGRDDGHAYGQIWHLAWAAEVAWKQGLDLFGELDNRLLATSELYSHHNLDPSGLTFIKFGSCYDLYPDWGSKKPSRRDPYALNLLLAAYGLRKGLPTPYTIQLRDQIKETQTSFLFRKCVDSSTANSLPPLIHPTTFAVTSLTSTDIGTVGLTGSATYDHDIWTVKGAGADIPVPPGTNSDAFHFAALEVKRDAVIVACVTGVETTDPAAKAGLMIRESLAPDAKYVGVFKLPSDINQVTWRGASAFCKTDISLLKPPGGYEYHPNATVPYWLKIERRGNRVSAYDSPDGTNWTALNSVEISMSTDAYMGLCVTSHSLATLCTATFTHLAITLPTLHGITPTK